MTYLLRVIPLLVFLYPFIKSIRKKNAIATVITGLFLFSSICSFFLDEEIMYYHDFNTDSISGFVLYSFLLLPFLLLSIRIKPIDDKSLLPNGYLMNGLMAIMIPGAFYSIVYLLPYAIRSMAMDASVVKGGLEVLPTSFLTTIAVGFPTFYYLYIFIFFTSIVQKRPKIISFSMLIGVLAFLVNIFTRANRDGPFFIVFGMLIGYFMFKPLLSKKQSKNIRTIFFLIGAVSLYLVFQITIERFSGRNKFDNGILSYMGMQPFIFSDWLKYNRIFNHGNSHFKLFLDLVGASSSSSFEYTDYYTWKFGTFLTNFYAVSGFTSLIGLSFLFWLYFKLNIGKLRKFNMLGIFFFLGFYFHFMISGLFYFRLGNSGGNLFMLLTILAVFLLKTKNRKTL